eukprot:CAMPEP_0170527964 /NCGR_PEP_ID=MMETSP0209-20121228/13452_1 /TAXON_ID=665100 ORGANISM="Litonotus pictus, Strain P1" /NCGR_SAMPLE_ID=MMETSP0209 /ASSEMBLY_ACC=CAM_ASM_000301 /LENGTH=596 /DNA_ID=CAMNT_0010818873 /DNA_START=9 /DNA_END=1799 /DNA_ORIENTATION=+
MEYLKKQEHEFTLSFKNIKYEIPIFNKDTKETVKKTIIHNTSGQAKSGHLSAIMGPSGSGKTSLMNFITNRIEFPADSTHQGQVFINSKEIPFEDIPDFSAYVMQDDLLFPVLTPYENLKFAIQLKKSVPEDQVNTFLDQIIADLQLSACKDTRVGNPEMKGISGGERKRTSIGLELISNPSILFLDEPTSALDSKTSLNIVTLLKKIASEKNILIMCTIHQPSSNIFSLFDNLMIIERGFVIYNNPPHDILNYFDSLNRPLEKNSNPSDAFMRMLENNSMTDHPDFFIEAYKEEAANTEKNIDSFLNTNKEGNGLSSKNSEDSSEMEQIAILTKRASLNVFRNPYFLGSKALMTVYLIFIICSVFWRLDGDTYDGVYGKIGYTFLIGGMAYFSELFGSALSFPIERAVFIKEHSSKMYTASAYYIAKNIAETPFSVIIPIIQVIVTYFATDMRTDSAEHFFILLIGVLLSSLVSQSMGYCVGTLFSTVSVATAAVDTIAMPFLIFAGLFVNSDSMPKYLFWIKYLSPPYHSNVILNTNEFKDNEDITYEKGGSDFLKGLNYDLSIGESVIIMVVYGIILRFVAYYFLKKMIRKSG